MGLNVRKAKDEGGVCPHMLTFTQCLVSVVSVLVAVPEVGSRERSR